MNRPSEILILFLWSCVFLAVPVHAQDTLKLWYKNPAEKWTDALPIGNGRLGAMIFGTVENERVQFNEETLWTGGPRDYHRDGAYQYLPQIRQLLAEGRQAEAEKLAGKEFMGLQSEEGKREVWMNDMRALKGLNGNPAMVNYEDADWKLMPVPSYEGWESIGFDGLDGAVWFRTSFTAPKEWEGNDLILDLNRIRDQDFTYVNGKLVGSMNSMDPRKYRVPKDAWKPGQNIIAIQVLNFFDKGGIAGYKDTTRHIGIYREGDSTNGISLVKAWKFKIQNNNPPAVPRYQAEYQPFGDLYLHFPDHARFNNYHRELDISNAISKTSYSVDGVRYIREYVSTAPGNVIAIRVKSDTKSKLNFEVKLASPHSGFNVKATGNNTIALSVKVKNGVLRGESRMRLINKGGTVATTDNKLIVRGADEVVMYLVAFTNFKSYKDVSTDPVRKCEEALERLKTVSFEKLLSDHTKEYRSYFDKLFIRFGNTPKEELPTDERIASFSSSADPAFAALYLQYGRYLLISSSRPGNQPANLQGIWNDLLTPPWGSKYTTNINAEMNYWPAEALNLSPMHDPLLTMIEELSEIGRQTAKAHYNARGWVLHHNTDLWRGTAPINASNHGIWVTGGAWLCHHLWERYEYTKDVVFLSKRAYPIMKEAALFFSDFLVTDPKTGWLISTPSNSPENGGLVAGPTMDHQIVRVLLKNCIKASEVLGTDPGLRAKWQETYNKIAPNQVGKFGQLQEWLEDKDDTSNKHRHVSHLWGVHPGNDITWQSSPALMKAARQSLLYRGDAGTGWSLAWKINFWARFKDGDHSYKMVKMLISPAAKGGGSYVNLFDAHPPFQIDGNFGGASGIGEMLIQSHDGYIDLLPSLPSELAEGRISGFCARGGFEIGMEWKSNQMVQVEILSKAGGPCVLKYGDKTTEFDTQKGKKYRLNAQLQKM